MVLQPLNYNFVVFVLVWNIYYVWMDIWEKKPSMKILTVGCHRLDTLSPCILGRPLQLPNAILPRWKMKSPEYSHRHIFCLIRTFSNDVTSECYNPRKVALLVSSGVPGGTWEAKFRSGMLTESAHEMSTLACWIQPPGWLLGLVLEFSPLVFITALGFLFFPTLGYYSALGFLFSPPWAIIQPLVFHFYPPLAKILSFSSLVYNISHPWFFTFFNPWLLFSPWFSLFPTLGYYPGFPLLPSLDKIPSFVYNISKPWFFTFFNPWLLFSPGFSLFPNLGYYPALVFLFFPP